MLGRSAGKKHNSGEDNKRVGYGFIHSAVDDHSRLAYSEIPGDERKETASDFWLRADARFGELGITVEEVLTDNGGCYCSMLFEQTLDDIKRRRTRPYRPRPTAKSSGSTAPCSRNGPIPGPTPQKLSGSTHLTSSCTSTITTAATPPWRQTAPQPGKRPTGSLQPARKATVAHVEGVDEGNRAHRFVDGAVNTDC
jgi:hypothetical protein